MFTNPVVGGIQLVRNAIRSLNYAAGVSGWSINRDGTAEFASGTFRGPVIIVEPGTGAILASVGADGNASFQEVNADDVIIGTTSLADFINGHHRGIVGQFRTTANLPDTGVSSNYAAICWTEFTYATNRLYHISGSTTLWKCNDAFGDSDLLIRVVINQPGVPGGAANEIVHVTKQSASAGETQNLNVDFYIHGATGRGNGTMTVALQMSTVSGTAWTNTNGATSQFEWTVEDVGPIPNSSGGTGAPAGLLTHTVTYYALDSRSYDENGVFIGAPDGDNNVYASEFPDRAFGEEQFEIIFNGASIAADLAGGTIEYARLYLYCHKAEEARGSIGFGVTTDVAVQAGTVGVPFVDNSDGSYADDDHWPNPGWAYYDMLNVSGGHSAIDRFVNHSGSGVIGHAALFGLAATGFRGFGYSAELRPYIEVRYVGNPPVGVGYGASRYGQDGYGM